VIHLSWSEQGLKIIEYEEEEEDNIKVGGRKGIKSKK